MCLLMNLHLNNGVVYCFLPLLMSCSTGHHRRHLTCVRRKNFLGNASARLCEWEGLICDTSFLDSGQWKREEEGETIKRGEENKSTSHLHCQRWEREKGLIVSESIILGTSFNPQEFVVPPSTASHFFSRRCSRIPISAIAKSVVSI